LPPAQHLVETNPTAQPVLRLQSPPHSAVSLVGAEFVEVVFDFVLPAKGSMALQSSSVRRRTI
jgi:hypothetical protein